MRVERPPSATPQGVEHAGKRGAVGLIDVAKGWNESNNKSEEE
jgi:hypothetical protein